MSEWAARRFWKKTQVKETGDGFEIYLDDRALRTPGRYGLTIPTRGLAEEIAREWEAQEETIQPASMPHTRMANSTIERIGQARPEVESYISGYGASDLLCYRAESPTALTQRQERAWDPLLNWAESQYGAKLQTTAGVMPTEQDSAALSLLHEAVKAHSDFALMALHDTVSLSGSLIIGLAALQDVLTPQELWDRARIDEIWQIEQWGEDNEAAEANRNRADAFFRACCFYQLSR